MRSGGNDNGGRARIESIADKGGKGLNQKTVIEVELYFVPTRGTGFGMKEGS
jgi:hypothetical protein